LGRLFKSGIFCNFIEARKLKNAVRRKREAPNKIKYQSPLQYAEELIGRKNNNNRRK